jgi:hypothetical protein
MARPKAHGNSQTIASLRDEAAENPPTRGAGAAGFGGAPTLSSNPIDSGERSVAAVTGEVFPTPYGGGASIVKQPAPRRVRGTSGSGAAGAVDGTTSLPS